MDQFTFLSSQIKTKEELFEYAWKRRYEIMSNNPGLYIHKDVYKHFVGGYITDGKIKTYKEVDVAINDVISTNPLDIAGQVQQQLIDEMYDDEVRQDEEEMDYLDWVSARWADENEEANQQQDERDEVMTTFTIKSSQTNQEMYVTIHNADILTKTPDELAAQIATTIVNTDLIK